MGVPGTTCYDIVSATAALLCNVEQQRYCDKVYDRSDMKVSFKGSVVFVLEVLRRCTVAYDITKSTQYTHKQDVLLFLVSPLHRERMSKGMKHVSCGGS